MLSSAPKVPVQGGQVAGDVEVDGIVHVVSGREVRKAAVGSHGLGLLYLLGDHGVPRRGGRDDCPSIIRGFGRVWAAVGFSSRYTCMTC